MAARCQQCRVMGRGVLVLQHEFETVVGTFSGHVHFLGGKCKCPSCRRQHRASPLFSLSLLYHARLPPLLPSPSLPCRIYPFWRYVPAMPQSSPQPGACLGTSGRGGAWRNPQSRYRGLFPSFHVLQTGACDLRTWVVGNRGTQECARRVVEGT